MNNELIERIDAEIRVLNTDCDSITLNRILIKQLSTLLSDCKAALTEKREDEDHRELEYHLLASEMVYEGNSVQHWRQKALAYKECAGVIYELKSLLGVETPADVLEQVKTQQQEAEPVAYLYKYSPPSGFTMQGDIASTRRMDITNSHWSEHSLYLRPPKPAAQPQVPDSFVLAAESALEFSASEDALSYPLTAKAHIEGLAGLILSLSAAKEEL